MKKFIFVAALAAGIAFGAHAQDKKISFGVRTGLNLSNISTKYTGAVEEGEKKSDYETDFKNRAGFHVGIIMDWQLGEKFYLQPGLYYTTRGGKENDSEEGYKYTQKWNMGYLQLPVLASYRFNLSDNVKWHLNAGPYIACGVGGKVKWEETYDGKTDKDDYPMFGTSDEESENMKNGIKRFDAGLSFGTGISISKMYVGLVYDLGLSNIADDKQWGKDYKIRNRNFAITVGYNF